MPLGSVSLEQLVSDPQHKEGFKQLFALMRASAFTSLSWSFDGSGDSGNMEKGVENYEGLHAETVRPKDVSCSLILKEPNGQTMNTKPDGTYEWVQLYEEAKVSNLEELGYQLALVVLNNDPHDWYNNDGGFGNIVFSITPENQNSIVVDMNVREVTSTSCPSEITFDNG